MIPLDLVRLFIFDISPCKTGPLLLINDYKYSPYPTKQKYPNTSKEARQPVLSSIILSLGCFFSSFDKPSFLKFRLEKNHRPRKINLIMGKYQWKDLDEFAQSYIAWLLVSLGQMIYIPTVSCPFQWQWQWQAKDCFPEVLVFLRSCSPSSPHLFPPPR